MPAPFTSPGLAQLEARHNHRCRTHPNTANIVAAIRAGDESVLADRIRCLQAGDDDAGLDAVYALSARIVPLVRCTVRRFADRVEGLDDHLTIAYLVLTAIDPNLDQLTNRVLSRTWRRYARPLETERRRPDQPSPFGPSIAERRELECSVARSGLDPTSDAVMHRLELTSTLKAARRQLSTGVMQPDVWQAIIDIRVHGNTSRNQPGHRSASGLRNAMARATTRLRDQSTFDEAA